MKLCPRCKLQLPVERFARNSARSDGLQSNCRKCVKVINAEYYARTPERNPQRRASGVAARDRARKHVLDYLQSHPCVDCGVSDPVVLQFDHVRGEKKSNISQMIRYSASIMLIDEEIEKCEVRCANCHARKTAEQFGWMKFNVV